MPAPVALALFAHPYDETLAAGGTLARLADDGWDVRVVLVRHRGHGRGQRGRGWRPAGRDGGGG